MAKVYCYRCKRLHEVPVSDLLLSVFHLLGFHVIRCPHCNRLTWHRHIIGDDESESAGQPFTPPSPTR